MWKCGWLRTSRWSGFPMRSRTQNVAQFLGELLAQLGLAMKGSGGILKDGDAPALILVGRDQCLDGVEGGIQVGLTLWDQAGDRAQHGYLRGEKARGPHDR